MGLLRMFSRKKEPEQVHLGNLSEWTSTKISATGAHKRLDQMHRETDKLVSELRTQLKSLEQATLINDKIPERAKQIMQGNRAQYVLAVEQFLEQYEKPEDPLVLEQTMYALGERMTLFEEKTRKNFYVLKEFLHDEVSAIVQTLKKIEDKVILTNSDIEKTGIYDFKTISEGLMELADMDEQKISLEKQAEQEKQQHTEIQERVKKYTTKIDELKASPGFSEHKELTQELEEKKQSLETLRRELDSSSSAVEKAVKKYTHKHEDKILSSFISSPLQVVQDKHEELALSLEQLNTKLANIGLSSKEQEKTQLALEQMSAFDLKKKKEEADTINEEIQAAEKRIKANVTHWTLVELEGLLSNATTQLDQQKFSYEQAKERIENIRPTLVTSKIKELVQKYGATFNDTEISSTTHFEESK